MDYLNSKLPVRNGKISIFTLLSSHLISTPLLCFALLLLQVLVNEKNRVNKYTEIGLFCLMQGPLTQNYFLLFVALDLHCCLFTWQIKGRRDSTWGGFHSILSTYITRVRPQIIEASVYFFFFCGSGTLFYLPDIGFLVWCSDKTNLILWRIVSLLNNSVGLKDRESHAAQDWETGGDWGGGGSWKAINIHK